ncbi:VOC family protein [Sandaracinus amylolyticus]|uniref:VOC family protein n=1 Tax=Sandaracinus amylolyticus TaxID=927083 RepID=UPI001F27B3B0|nr:VOC family protein [Sandaracinus amylolyticus]UJR84409.1 Hypothetical protein I5071_64880 [Sandaracinus amylolyticus]
MDPITLRGVCTVVLHADDHAAAKRWYSELLGVEPYFDRPGYAEFRIGDYQHELGLLDARFRHALGGTEGTATGPTGVVTYWYVDDVPKMIERLVSMGAKLHHPPRDFGAGFIGASVIDPFGNILGVMFNPHYLEVLEGKKRAAASA